MTAALRLLSDHILHLDDTVTSTDGKTLTVLECLKSKHPSGSPDSVLQDVGEPPFIHPVVFESLHVVVIR